MGVTIHYTLGQEKSKVKETVDAVERKAIEIKQQELPKIGGKFEITRESDMSLIVNIGSCESLVFDFRSLSEWEKKHLKYGWDYTYTTVMGEIKSKRIDKGLYFSSDFCKTQYDKPEGHVWVAELIRVAANMSKYAKVVDEGDYYHSVDS